MIRSRIERRRAGLPPARCRTTLSLEWMAADDGARLATRFVRPVDPEMRRPSSDTPIFREARAAPISSCMSRASDTLSFSAMVCMYAASARS